MPPTDVGNLLRAVKNAIGGDDVLLTFDTPAAVDKWFAVFRDLDKVLTPTVKVQSYEKVLLGTTALSDVGAVPGSPNLYYYSVFGVSSLCFAPGSPG